MTEIIAHRGFSGIAPENTLLAFEKAIQVGVDLIELDVHMTKDRHLVVIHDETVDRTTTGKGWVKKMTLAEIKKLQITSQIKDQANICQNISVPMLEEVLSLLITQPQITLNIEMKTDKIEDFGIEQAVLNITSKYHMQDRVVYSSFHHETLNRLKAENPKSRIILLFSVQTLPRYPWKYALQLGAEAIHPHHWNVNQKLIESCNEFEIKVRPYTVNHKLRLYQLLKINVDGIITNFPNRLKELISQM